MPKQIPLALSFSPSKLGVKEDVDQLVRVQRDEKHTAILDWLTPVDYGTQQSDYIQRRQEGTGQWLLESDHFKKWLEGGERTLFCPGIPGAGKTILTSTVVEYLHSVFPRDTESGIGYIYFNYKQQDEQTINDLLASLLKQLTGARQSLPKVLQDLYDQHKTERTRPTVDELSRALHSVTGMFSRVFIVIDALDECQYEYRTKFLSRIFQLQTAARVYIFATSRFIPDIEHLFEDSLVQEIRATAEDIGRYVSGQIDQLPSCVQNKRQLQEEIKVGVSEAVDGMYVCSG